MTRSWFFFDAVGTLFTVRGSIGGQYERAARPFGARFDAAEIQRAFHRHFAQMKPPARRGRGEALRRAEFRWWKELARSVFDELGMFAEFDRYFEQIFWMFGTARCWDIYPETPATLRALAECGWSIGVISNFDSRLPPLLQDLGLRPWIDQVTLPSTAGAAKPAAGIFKTACRQAGTSPAQCWYIGDSLTDDYEAARRAGLRTILLDRHNRHTDFHGMKVKRLSEIFALMGEPARAAKEAETAAAGTRRKRGETSHGGV
ncbi:MAG: HAD-IA family hydrolase [Acidobacteria bacterium]|nr:HAD-IA family hydrolase [Acidobacteriota bacterium]